MADAGFTLRRATMSDAAAIARVLQNSLASLGEQPMHGPAADELSFIRDDVLLSRTVTVAQAGTSIVGFIATRKAWVDLLYVEPAWTGQGIGSRLLATVDEGETKLFCFRSNALARHFYERHGFHSQAASRRAGNLPDMLYVRAGTPL